MMMRYSECSPPVALRPFVKRLWVERGTALPSRLGHTALPDGCMQVIFNLGSRELRHEPHGMPVHHGPAFLVGPATRPEMVYVSGCADTIGIQFRPGGASAFFGLPASELTEATVDLSTLWGSQAADIVDRLRAVDSNPARFRIIEGALLERIDYRPGDLSLIAEAVDLINRSSDRITMGDLAADLGLSSRHLRRKFDDLVGVSPKFLARIIRFHRAAACIRKQGYSEGARLAYDCGYADQAHLIHEFRELSGRTPAQFSAAD